MLHHTLACIAKWNGQICIGSNRWKNIYVCFSVHSSHSSPNLAQNNPLQELLSASGNRECTGNRFEDLSLAHTFSQTNTWRNPYAINSFPSLGNLSDRIRILVSGPLALWEAVFITDPCHQIFQPCDPGSCFLSTGRYQVKRFHMVSIVDAEAAVGIETAIGIALKDLWLLPLANLLNRVNGN